MILDGVRLVPLTDEMPPVFSYLLWRTGDQDPALRNVLGLSEQVLPTVAGAIGAGPAREVHC